MLWDRKPWETMLETASSCSTKIWEPAIVNVLHGIRLRVCAFSWLPRASLTMAPRPTTRLACAVLQGPAQQSRGLFAIFQTQIVAAPNHAAQTQLAGMTMEPTALVVQLIATPPQGDSATLCRTFAPNMPTQEVYSRT